MRNYFIFDNENSKNYGVYISGQGTFDAPERNYKTIAVPGRDGALLGVDHRLENIGLTYNAFIYANFKTNIAALRSMLLSKTGYRRLTDTYHSDEFRLAYYRGGLEAEVTPKNDAGEFEIEFECKPQRYLLSGETETAIASGGTITNPTLFASKPLIEVVGYGELTINSQTITIANTFPSITIDCELQDCYYGLQNANRQVVIEGNSFPELKPGVNSFAYDNTITSVSVVPKWWRV